ncbi:hypothetical protein EDD11_000693 [Mortierella claussenii]|nr:hypothetical protein EDD11_000693 [Mortierella claussenii]
MKISAILSALAAATLVSAGKFHELKPGKSHHNILPNAFIIEYHDGVKHDEAQNALTSHQVDYKVRNHYNIFNGAAITVNSKHDGHSLAQIPGVKNVWHVALYDMPKGIKSSKKPTDPETTSDHVMTGVNVLHEKYKLTGKGIKIGVIDTGIDYKHPAFAAPGAEEGCFSRYGKNCRVAHGWDFVGDDYTGGNTPKPDADPMDCFGHGSHVAGIIGGNALNIKSSPKPPQPFVGVAPEVTLGAYRIFGCNGQSGEDVILAAMELAFNDGMDVINMSLGGGSSYQTNPTAVLAEKLIVRGMALAGAAGNDGSDGVWMVSDTGLGDHATSVASFDNLYNNLYSFTYGSKKFPYNWSDAYGKAITLPSTDTLLPIFEKSGALSDGCDPAVYKGVDVKNKVVLVAGDVTRCKSGGRGANALTAGAAGIIIKSLDGGIDSLGGVANLPMASVDGTTGDQLLVIWKANAKTPIVWSTKPEPFIVDGAGTPSVFSSFGLDGDLRSKPDVSAPGGNILSTYPLAKGGYAVLSGTSMATPYIAGSHALYMQAKKAKPHGDAIRQVFKNTATIFKSAKTKTVTSAVKQGAGLVNVLNAVLTTASISPDHIDLLDSVNFAKTVKLTLKNTGKLTETYTFSHVGADALNSYNGTNTFPFGTPEVEADYATVQFSQNQVKLGAGKSAKITLTFKEPKKGSAAHWPIYSGYVVATPKTKGGVAVHVPYTGVKGDIRKVPIMDTSLGFPVLQVANATGSISDVPKDFVFDFKNNRPAVLTRLGSHTPDATIRVFDNSDKFVGFLNSIDNGPAFGPLGRQKNVDDTTGALVFNQFTWGGSVLSAENATLTPTTVGAGTYRIVVASQKKFTKGVYPADFEVFELAKVNVAEAASVPI